MKNIFLKLFIAISSLLSIAIIFSSCGTGKDKTGNQDSTNVEASNKPAPGEIPFDFPVTSTTSKTGEYVLCPSKSFIDESWGEEGANSTFIFYSRTMATPGAAESEVTEINENVVIPNSLIIPIPANQEAKKGDILLTWWQSGSGMVRAIVTDDSNPKEPKVKYLDLDWEYYGETEDVLKPNSFVKITDILQPGTSVAYKDDYYMNHVQVIKIEGEKVLTLGWAGRIAVVNKKDCFPIPVTIELKAGDKVQVPHIGSYTNGTVKKYDAKVGRAWVEIDFGGQKQEIVVAIGDIAKDLKLE